jgi:hypothetical protein
MKIRITFIFYVQILIYFIYIFPKLFFEAVELRFFADVFGCQDGSVPVVGLFTIN